MKYHIHAPFHIERASGYESIQVHLCKRILNFVRLELHLSKKVSLSKRESQIFFENIATQAENALVIAFDERGDALDSKSFAKVLATEELCGTKTIHFCIGGAYGLPEELGHAKRLKTIALSSMTHCHELAFITVLEQIYRARTIISGHPYHHAEASDLMRKRRS